MPARAPAGRRRRLLRPSVLRSSVLPYSRVLSLAGEKSVAEFSRQTFVVDHPVVDRVDGVFVLVFADDHFPDARVDDLPFAHTAGGGAGHDLSGFGIDARHIEACADHILARGGDDRVRLGVDRAAEFIPLSARDVQFGPAANSEVRAVLASARRAVVAGGDDRIVFHDETRKEKSGRRGRENPPSNSDNR